MSKNEDKEAKRQIVETMTFTNDRRIDQMLKTIQEIIERLDVVFNKVRELELAKQAEERRE